MVHVVSTSGVQEEEVLRSMAVMVQTCSQWDFPARVSARGALGSPWSRSAAQVSHGHGGSGALVASLLPV